MDSFRSGPATPQGQNNGHQGFYALVGYIPDPLGSYLNHLRTELVAGCRLRSHVTLLPPRLLRANCSTLIQELEKRSRLLPPFQVTLGEIEYFETTRVIYISIERGWKQILESHELLAEGLFAFEEYYPFHPHMTLAQDVRGDTFEEVLDLARRRWQDCPYSRSFEVRNLTFVQNVDPNRWDTLSEHILSGAPNRATRPETG